MALSADGNVALIGSPEINDAGTSEAGAAWVFTRNSGRAMEPAGGQARRHRRDWPAAYQGSSVALSADGDTALIGGPGDNNRTGAAWLFTRSNGVWRQQKLVGSNAIGAALEGSSVALSPDGNTALIGGYGDNNFTGAAWVFTRDSNGQWSQQHKLVETSATGAHQGWSVALAADGSTALIGGPYDNGYLGAAWVFTRSGGEWSQQGDKLVGTGAQPPPPGSSYGPAQGDSVALSGDGKTALIGGPGDDDHTGAAWVFTRDSDGQWSQQGDKLIGTGASGAAYQGSSVALSADGDTALIGGPGDNSGTGAAWQFARANSKWTQQRDKLVGTGASGAAYQGLSVALSADGETALVGGPYDNGGSTANGGRGAAWVFVSGLTQTITFTSSPSPAAVGGRYTPTATGGGSGNPVVFNIDSSSGAGVCSFDSSTTTVSFTGAGTCVIDANQAGDSHYFPARQQQQSVTVLSVPPNSKLVGAGARRLAQQGYSVALSAEGNTALIGGRNDNGGVGAAWVFTSSNGVWTQQAKLVGADAAGIAGQGWSVALSADGNTALIGAPGDNNQTGAAWVFTRSNGVWTQQAKLVSADSTDYAYQGWSVALCADGNTALIGTRTNYDGGAWVFTRSNGEWTQQGAKLSGTGFAGISNQGSSVALAADGNTALIGGPNDQGGAGAAWVFTRSDSNWSQQGSKLVGTGAAGSAGQGSSVALSGDGSRALIGGPQDHSLTGAAWVFTRSNGVWTQQGSKLVGVGAAGSAGQGSSVALSADGSRALIGGPDDQGGTGAAWVFARSDSTSGWSQQGVKLIGTGAIGAAKQGSSAALSANGNTALIGAPEDNDDAGAAWVFTYGPAPPIIDDHYTVSHIKTHRDGTVTFMVKVPRPGTIEVLETSCAPSRRPRVEMARVRPGPDCYAFARLHRRLGSAGRWPVKVRPGARGSRQVQHHHRPVRLNLRVTYQPTGGTPRRARFRNLLVPSPGGHRSHH